MRYRSASRLQWVCCSRCLSKIIAIVISTLSESKLILAKWSTSGDFYRAATVWKSGFLVRTKKVTTPKKLIRIGPAALIRDRFWRSMLCFPIIERILSSVAEQSEYLGIAQVPPVAASHGLDFFKDDFKINLTEHLIGPFTRPPHNTFGWTCLEY